MLFFACFQDRSTPVEPFSAEKEMEDIAKKKTENVSQSCFSQNFDCFKNLFCCHNCCTPSSTILHSLSDNESPSKFPIVPTFTTKNNHLNSKDATKYLYHISDMNIDPSPSPPNVCAELSTEDSEKQ